MSQPFATIRSEGGLLPPDLLARIARGDRTVPGLTPAAYRLDDNQQFGEAISRSWNRMLPTWHAFRAELSKLAADDPATVLTREKLLQPLLQELGYGRVAPLKKAISVDDRDYAISHAWGDVPIHLLGAGTSLDDRTAGQKGAAKSSPHGLVQDLLNRSEPHLWALLSNGLVLRLLRDHHSLTTQAYVEVDLEALFEGERYSDFALMWLVFHQSRIEPQEDKIDRCWLEQWFTLARTEGVAFLDGLRDGVVVAIEALGRGFLKHARNNKLGEDLRDGVLDRQDYYRELLRLVYRLIFLFSTEDRPSTENRPLLLDPNASRAVCERYLKYYSMRRLRDLAGMTRGGPHGDLWQALRAVMNGLDNGCAALGLPALGSFLWSKEAVPHLDRCELANADLLAAVRALTYVERHRQQFPVSWRTVAADELGSIYESLLELHPKLDPFKLESVAGNERRNTGSYYTRTTLVECVLERALDPAIDDAVRGKSRADAEAALLALKVVDPACGSGHFLVAAARRLARRLATVRTSDDEPSPREMQRALRDVVGRCIYGVDVNEMAVELCKIALWMEALEPGKPLSFLDAHVQHGNALIGATPELIARGIPDDAFETLHGDDPSVAKSLRKRNREARTTGQGTLWALLSEERDATGALGAEVAAAGRAALSGYDQTLPEIRARAQRWESFQQSDTYRTATFIADLWCSAFLWPKQLAAETDAAPAIDVFLRICQDPTAAPAAVKRIVGALAQEYRFFHWHLAFPEVFSFRWGHGSAPQDVSWDGGFDVVLGNPPWDELTPSTNEFFSTYDANVRFVDGASQDEIVERLQSDPIIAAEWNTYCRRLFGQIHFLKNSGRYRLFAPGNLGKGDFNVYRMFVETAMEVTAVGGRTSQLAPETLYNGANTFAIRQALLTRFRWTLLLGFENAKEVWFKDVDTRMKFCIYAAQKGESSDMLNVAFNLRTPTALAEALSGSTLRLPVQMIREFSPEALAIMELASQVDIDVAAQLYAAVPAFGAPHLRPRHFHMRELDMTNDKRLFTESPEGLPLYEGRMVDAFDHRAKAYVSGRARAAEWRDLPFSDPAKEISPQWRVLERDVVDRLQDRHRKYRLGFCNIASPTNERTLVAALIPPGVVCGNKIPTIVYEDGYEWSYMLWLAAANSFVVDFLARKKVSLTMTNTILDSLPLPKLPPDVPAVRRLVQLAAELTCTAPEMASYWNMLARDGWLASPWPPSDASDDSAREIRRAEIDAIVAVHVYGLAVEQVSYVLDTFPIVRRRDEALHGEYRTKRLVLEKCDTVSSNLALRPLQNTVVPTSRLPTAASSAAFESLASSAALDGAWATPDGTDIASATLLVLTEVLRLTPTLVDAQRVRWAVLLAQRPALASPLLSEELREKWQRLVGVEARPRPADVTGLDQFRKAPDRTFATFVKQLKSSKHLVVEGDQWRGASNLPASRLEWVSGRAATAVEIAQRLDLATASQVIANLVAKAATG